MLCNSKCCVVLILPVPVPVGSPPWIWKQKKLLLGLADVGCRVLHVEVCQIQVWPAIIEELFSLLITGKCSISVKWSKETLICDLTIFPFVQQPNWSHVPFVSSQCQSFPGYCSLLMLSSIIVSMEEYFSQTLQVLTTGTALGEILKSWFLYCLFGCYVLQRRWGQRSISHVRLQKVTAKWRKHRMKPIAILKYSEEGRANVYMWMERNAVDLFVQT